MWPISFTLALTAALLCNLHAPAGTETQWRSSCAGPVLLVGPWSSAWRSSTTPGPVPSAHPLSVAAIQGNIEQSMKWDPAQLNAQLALYRDMSFSSKPVDLLMWPETAVPVLKESAEGYLEHDGQLRRRPTLGADHRRADTPGRCTTQNATTTASPWSAKATALTSKQKLVPFGE